MGSAEIKIIEQIKNRASVGLQKYGTTTDRTDLTAEQWIEHLTEELLDAAIYNKKVIESMQELKDVCMLYYELSKEEMSFDEAMGLQYNIFLSAMKLILGEDKYNKWLEDDNLY